MVIHLLYSRNTNISRNIIKHNVRTSINERIHFFIKIYLSHFIHERVMFVVCERSVETGTDCYIDPNSSRDHSSTSSVGYWGPKALRLPLALNSTSCLQLTRTVWAPGILLFNFHLLFLFFRLFTQVHLLIDGSVEGQYITHLHCE